MESCQKPPQKLENHYRGAMFVLWLVSKWSSLETCLEPKQSEVHTQFTDILINCQIKETNYETILYIFFTILFPSPDTRKINNFCRLNKKKQRKKGCQISILFRLLKKFHFALKSVVHGSDWINEYVTLICFASLKTHGVYPLEPRTGQLRNRNATTFWYWLVYYNLSFPLSQNRPPPSSPLSFLTPVSHPQSLNWNIS